MRLAARLPSSLPLTLAMQGGSVDKNVLEELAEVKRSYFFSLGVGMKLNLSIQGKPCNINVAQLFEEANSTVPFRLWNAWLTSKIQQSTQEEERAIAAAAAASRSRPPARPSPTRAAPSPPASAPAPRGSSAAPVRGGAPRGSGPPPSSTGGRR